MWRIPDLVAGFKGSVENHLADPVRLEPARLRSWGLLQVYNRFLPLKTKAVIAQLRGDGSEKALWQSYINELALTEPQTSGTLDFYWSLSQTPVKDAKPDPVK
ncbi:MAG: hypothetical protein Q4G68_13505 [Planctomycetia bacterium]|nr:hypothetical protein [Planctomycetia bacterium]